MDITEIPKRHGLKVSKMRMTCNDCGHDVPFPLQRSNFFYIISGNPGSGKTNLWLNLISRRKWAYNQQAHKVYIFSNSLHTIKKKLKLPDEQLIHGFSPESLQEVLDAEEEEESQLEEGEESNRIIMIFDDVVTQIKKHIQPMLKLIYNRRHIGGGCSVMLTTQKFNKIPLELRAVASGIFFFNTKNKAEIDALFREYIALSREEFMKVLKFVFDAPHNFLYINLELPGDKSLFKNFNQLRITETSSKTSASQSVRQDVRVQVD